MAADICKKLPVIAYQSTILESPIEYLKGVGPLKGDLLRKELGIFTFGDLLVHFPFRHIDKSRVSTLAEISPQSEYIQVAVSVTAITLLGEKRSRRLSVQVADATGSLELVWFQGIAWVQKGLRIGQDLLVFGKVSFFNGKAQITHPEFESLALAGSGGKAFLEPIYPTTEKLRTRGLSGRQLGRLTQALLPQITEKDLPENLPEAIVHQLKLVPRLKAFQDIHFPKSESAYAAALRRLKFEELFIAQVRLNMLRISRHLHSQGVVFKKVGTLFTTFYDRHLPFKLTGAQKRVIREIRSDTAHGRQMNRLLQGDVGSGKTIVALLVMLLAADNGFQSCLMAPTEILARQHFNNLTELLTGLPVEIRLLTGSTRARERKAILTGLLEGTNHILVGTHAIIEDTVSFKNLGIAVVDEQHRFGVAQRAALWKKSPVPPHILVMTATPIPRTLAMTAYGDLDYSIMDELPEGRQPVTTVHRFETQRSKVMEFIKTEIDKGRQSYIVYPLIEESEKLSYEDLMQGYEQVKSYFPEPRYRISMVHGRMTGEQKEINMQRFSSGNTQILVGTTVIEVGVNVPNAGVMVIESAEKFGLSQLHQLRGRVGRDSKKSFCILLTSSKLGNDAKERLNIMCTTNDGFKIAEKDLALRGPGEIEGTRQSGALNFRLASIVTDRDILITAGKFAAALVQKDPDLVLEENRELKRFLQSQRLKTAWSRIS